MSVNNWIRLMEWRNMSSELFEHISEMSKRFKAQTGHTLHMSGTGSGWSELGYWKDKTPH